jgi:hypothetical protein
VSVLGGDSQAIAVAQAYYAKVYMSCPTTVAPHQAETNTRPHFTNVEIGIHRTLFQFQIL